MALNISNPFANKAQLRVEVGKTSVEELAKFQAKAEAKGGGQLRAKQNKDGSFTLYVAADRKIRLSGNGEKARAARGAKQELAKNLVKDIILRRLPSEKSTSGGEALLGKHGYKYTDPAGDRTKALLGRIDNRTGTSGLKDTLKEVSSQTTETVRDTMSQTTVNHLTAKFTVLDNVMKEPLMQAALGKYMEGEHVKENFDFECTMREFDNIKDDPAAKMKLAESIFQDFIEAPEGDEANPFEFSENSPESRELNLSGTLKGEITKDIEELRAEFSQNKGKLSPESQNKLDKLFSEARTVVQTNFAGGSVGTGDVDTVLKKFAKTEPFKEALGQFIATTANTDRNELNPARILPPGSGKEFQEAMYLDNVLGDTQLRETFRNHLESQSKGDQLDRYETLQQLEIMAGDSENTDLGLLSLLQKLVPGSGDSLRTNSSVFNDSEDGIKGLDEDIDQPQQEQLEAPRRDDFAGRIKVLNQRGLGDIEPNQLRNEINELIKDMQGDSANELRYSLDGIKDKVADRLAHDKLEWQVGNEKHYGTFEQFAGKKLESSGGATGSGRTKIGKQYYQVKDSIGHASLKRRLKAKGLNTENYGEVISSNIARAMRGAKDRQLIPEVSLRQNSATHEAVVTSRYLPNGKGDLDVHYMKEVGPLPKGQRHVKVELDSTEPSSGGVLRLSGTAAKDIQINIALSALMGDHDVNPANMLSVEGNRVGRIDFGHAFNELLAGPETFGGGGVRNQNNRILDFFNREKIGGQPFTDQQIPKLWRDYTGAGHSAGMTEALRTIASSNDSLEGLVQAKTQFTDLIAQLETEGTSAAKKEIQDLTNSLKQISKNVGKPVTSSDSGDVVRDVFQNLATFISDGQAQMRQVADLSELQTKIDTFLDGPNSSGAIPQDIQELYAGLMGEGSTVKLENGSGLTWMKTAGDKPAFSGNLEAYIQDRRGG